MTSPTRDLKGASRETGGILQGHAIGNVFNFADAEDMVDQQVPVMGKVNVHTTHADPKVSMPYMSLKAEVTNDLAPVLQKLESHYSPVRHM